MDSEERFVKGLSGCVEIRCLDSVCLLIMWVVRLVRVVLVVSVMCVNSGC